MESAERVDPVDVDCVWKVQGCVCPEVVVDVLEDLLIIVIP